MQLCTKFGKDFETVICYYIDPVIQLLCVKWGGSTSHSVALCQVGGGSTSHSVVMCQVGGAPTPTGTLMFLCVEIFCTQIKCEAKIQWGYAIGAFEWVG